MTDMTSKFDLNFPKGGGEMGALMREHNWRATNLGAPADWPRSVRTSGCKDFYMRTLIAVLLLGLLAGCPQHVPPPKPKATELPSDTHRVQATVLTGPSPLFAQGTLARSARAQGLSRGRQVRM